MSDDNGSKTEGNAVWLTHHEIDFLVKLGSWNEDRPRNHKMLLQNYLEATADRSLWNFGDTRLDRFEITEAVRKMLSKM